jgi:hypothetical protein
VFCDSNPVTATIQHVVTLGVFCTVLPPDDPYYFADPYFECTESTDQFEPLTDDMLFNTPADRFTCAASKILAPGSTSSNPQIISTVAITTDDTWLSILDESCFTQYFSAAPVPLTNAPVTPTPTVVMNTTSPSLFTTLPPTDAQINPPAVTAPILPREATTPRLSGESTASSSNNNNGVLIGGVVGGITAVLVIWSWIGFLVWRRKTIDSGDAPTISWLSSTSVRVGHAANVANSISTNVDNAANTTDLSSIHYR